MVSGPAFAISPAFEAPRGKPLDWVTLSPKPHMRARMGCCSTSRLRRRSEHQPQTSGQAIVSQHGQGHEYQSGRISQRGESRRNLRIGTYAYLRVATTVDTASNLEVPASPAAGGGCC